MALKNYMGKRRVLDSFFSKVLKAVQKQFPTHKIQIAYGEAGLTMSPTGKGEVAVPTGGTFKACQRIMGADRVVPTDEFRSTAICWETGKKKELVYRVIDEHGKLSMDHTSAKYPPLVPQERLAAFEKYKIARAKKERDRKRGWLILDNEGDNDNDANGDQKAACYPEVRGLRFCPERRKYVGRDVEAAITIGRLRMFQILKGLRPEPFCRGITIQN